MALDRNSLTVNRGGTETLTAMILPENAKKQTDGDAPFKTLFLLHGLSDDHTTWMRQTSIERYANEYGIAVVMPAGDRSWYNDTADGAHYLTFIGKELPDVCRAYFRGMSDRREDTLIAGLSMGGYGAVKTALTYPERFGGAASLSGALDVVARTRRGAEKGQDVSAEWRGIFGFHVQAVSTTLAAGAFKQLAAHERSENAFEILFRNLLAGRKFLQLHETFLAVTGKVNHHAQRVSTFCRNPHEFLFTTNIKCFADLRAPYRILR